MISTTILKSSAPLTTRCHETFRGHPGFPPSILCRAALLVRHRRTWQRSPASAPGIGPPSRLCDQCRASQLRQLLMTIVCQRNNIILEYHTMFMPRIAVGIPYYVIQWYQHLSTKNNNTCNSSNDWIGNLLVAVIRKPWFIGNPKIIDLISQEPRWTPLTWVHNTWCRQI